MSCLIPPHEIGVSGPLVKDRKALKISEEGKLLFLIRARLEQSIKKLVDDRDLRYNS